MLKYGTTLENSLAVSQIVKKITLLQNSAIPLLSIDPRETKMCVYTKICTLMVTALLFFIAQS